MHDVVPNSSCFSDNSIFKVKIGGVGLGGVRDGEEREGTFCILAQHCHLISLHSTSSFITWNFDQIY